MGETNTKRIVVKVGTSSLTHSTGALDLRGMERLVRSIADLRGEGYEVILVSSGAIAADETGALRLTGTVRILRRREAEITI